MCALCPFIQFLGVAWPIPPAWLACDLARLCLWAGWAYLLPACSVASFLPPTCLLPPSSLLPACYLLWWGGRGSGSVSGSVRTLVGLIPIPLTVFSGRSYPDPNVGILCRFYPDPDVGILCRSYPDHDEGILWVGIGNANLLYGLIVWSETIMSTVSPTVTLTLTVPIPYQVSVLQCSRYRDVRSKVLIL